MDSLMIKTPAHKPSFASEVTSEASVVTLAASQATTVSTVRPAGPLVSETSSTTSPTNFSSTQPSLAHPRADHEPEFSNYSYQAPKQLPDQAPNQLPDQLSEQPPVKVEPTMSSSLSPSSSSTQPMIKCPVCPQNFESRDKDDYRRHLLHHVDEEDDETVCPACPFASMDAKLVVEHFMSTHGNLDKLRCTHFGCNRKFWVQRDYLRHLKNHGPRVL